MTNVDVNICSFGEATITLTYDDVTGKLVSLTSDNPRKDWVITARIRHTSGRALIRDLDATEKTVDIPAQLINAAGKRTDASTEREPGPAGWAGLEIGFQFRPVRA